MRTVQFVRSSVTLLTAAALAGLSGVGFTEEKAEPKAEVVWKQIGEASGVVGLAAVGKELFAVTSGKMYAIVDTKELGSETTLMVRENAGEANASAGKGLDGIPWKGVDRRPPAGALAMTESGGKYYVVTKEDGLFVGDPTKPEVQWKQIGDAAGVTILAGSDGKLFAATKSGKLLMCEPQAAK